MNKNKGFTLIELLVVIAIIGILASVVLASLNSARNKGADAAVKSNLANARAQAEIFYDSNGNRYYGGSTATDVCNVSGSVGSPAIKGIYPNVLSATKATGLAAPNTTLTTVQTATTAVCHSNATAWAASVTLKDTTGGTNYYCVDSSGNAIQTLNVLAASSVLCS